MMREDARTIANRLGLDEAVIRRLQQRGYLLALPLSDEDVRRHLYTAHSDWARRVQRPTERR